MYTLRLFTLTFLQCFGLNFATAENSTTQCLQDQQAYVEWLAGQEPNYNCVTYDWERKCNELGYYDKVQSQANPFHPHVRQFCSSPDGDRLFGSADYGDMEIKCDCSVKTWEIQQDANLPESRVNDGNPYLHPREDVSLHCQINGNFEELQCDSGLCWCMDLGTGVPATTTIHENLFQLLDCFDESLHSDQYLRRCESRKQGKAQSRKKLLLHGCDWLPDHDHDCDGDGSFGVISCNHDDRICQCVDKYGQRISNFYMSGITQHNDMDCQCARDEHEGLTQLFCTLGFGAYDELQTFQTVEYCVDEYGFQKTAAYSHKEPPCKIKTCQKSNDFCNDYDHDNPPNPLPCQSCNDINC